MENKDEFKENMEELRKMSEKIKDPDVPLEEAISSFEKGMEYYKKCDSILKDAEQRIEVIRKEMETSES